MISSEPEPGPAPAASGSRKKETASFGVIRSTARLRAVQALYQSEITNAPVEEIREEFEEHRLSQPLDGVEIARADVKHFRALLRGVLARQSEIDRATDKALVARWPIEKLDPVLRAVFRAGGCELLTMHDIPLRVVLNEYVEVTRAFYPGEREAKFTNGVLHHMGQALRGETTPPTSGGPAGEAV